MLVTSQVQKTLANWITRPLLELSPLNKRILAVAAVGIAAWLTIPALVRQITFKKLLGRVHDKAVLFHKISFLMPGDKLQIGLDAQNRAVLVLTHYKNKERVKGESTPEALEWLNKALVDADEDRRDLVTFIYKSSSLKVKRTALEALDLLRYRMENAQKYIKSLFPENSRTQVQVDSNIKQIHAAIFAVGKQIFAASSKKFTKSTPADGQDLVHDLLIGKNVDIRPEPITSHAHSLEVPGQFKKDIDRLDTVWICNKEYYGKERGMDAAFTLYESLCACHSLGAKAAFNLAKLLVQSHFVPHDQHARDYFRAQGLTATQASGQLIAIDFDTKGNVKVALMMIYSCKDSDPDNYLPHPPTICINRFLKIPAAELAKPNYEGQGVEIDDRIATDCVNPQVAKDAIEKHLANGYGLNQEK